MVHSQLVYKGLASRGLSLFVGLRRKHADPLVIKIGEMFEILRELPRLRDIWQFVSRVVGCFS